MRADKEQNNANSSPRFFAPRANDSTKASNPNHSEPSTTPKNTASEPPELQPKPKEKETCCCCLNWVLPLP